MQVEPDQMTIEEIHLVRDQFIAAAVRAKKAAFAARLADETDVPVILVGGMITSPMVTRQVF